MTRPVSTQARIGILSSLWEAGKDLLFPPSCLGCKQQLPGWQALLFCPSCRDRIRFLKTPFCRCCGMPFAGSGDHLCADCLQGTFVFTKARAAVLYQEPVITPILAFKYSGEMTGLETFATLAGISARLKDLPKTDYIIPVPLHSKRLRERGFNQADLLAHRFFPHSPHKIRLDILLRARHTTTQSGQSGKARRLNLHNAFCLGRPEEICGKSILLVDDVFTTGTTVNECSKILLAAGASQVVVFTLARTS